jgi:hypothetical protein
MRRNAIGGHFRYRAATAGRCFLHGDGGLLPVVAFYIVGVDYQRWVGGVASAERTITQADRFLPI